MIITLMHIDRKLNKLIQSIVSTINLCMLDISISTNHHIYFDVTFCCVLIIIICFTFIHLFNFVQTFVLSIYPSISVIKKDQTEI